MSKLTRNGVTLHYEVHSRDPTLLLSHGFSATSAMREGQIEALSAKHRLVLRDMLPQRDAMVFNIQPGIKVPAKVLVSSRDPPFVAATDYVAAAWLPHNFINFRRRARARRSASGSWRLSASAAPSSTGP